MNNIINIFILILFSGFFRQCGIFLFCLFHFIICKHSFIIFLITPVVTCFLMQYLFFALFLLCKWCILNTDRQKTRTIRKRTWRQTMADRNANTINIEWNEPHIKPRLNSNATVEYADHVPLVTYVVTYTWTVE
jgi:hypothetical protein